MQHYTNPIENIRHYYKPYEQTLLQTIESLLKVFNCVFGLVVWFSLRAREILDSNPKRILAVMIWKIQKADCSSPLVQHQHLITTVNLKEALPKKQPQHLILAKHTRNIRETPAKGNIHCSKASSLFFFFLVMLPNLMALFELMSLGLVLLNVLCRK